MIVSISMTSPIPWIGRGQWVEPNNVLDLGLAGIPLICLCCVLQYGKL